MAISLVGAHGVRNLWTTEPAGTKEKDVLIAVTSNDENNPTSPPSGWTQIGPTLTGGAYNSSIQVWTILRGVSPVNMTWTTAVINTPTLTVSAWRGALGISVSATSSLGSLVAPSVDVPADTDLDDQSMLISILGDGYWIDATVPEGMTQVVEQNTTANATTMAYQLVPPGPTGTRQFLTTSTSVVGSWSVVLEPDPNYSAIPEGDAEGTFNWHGVATGSSVPTPTGLVATLIEFNQVDLSWNPSSGSKGYDIERNGIIIATDVVGTTYSDTNGITPETVYTYRVRAVKK